jgi:anti-anti-sigma factor
MSLIIDVVKLLISKDAREVIGAISDSVRKSPEWMRDLTSLHRIFEVTQSNEAKVLVGHTLGVLASNGWPEEQIGVVEFVSHELMTNAFTHGIGKRSNGRVHVDVDLGPQFYRILIKDTGRGFHLTKELQRQRYLDERPETWHALTYVSRSVESLTQPKGNRSICAVIKRTPLKLTTEILVEPRKVAIMTVEGDIDLDTAPQLKKAIIELIDSGHYNIILNTTSSGDYLDSAGLEVLMAAVRRLRDGTPSGSISLVPGLKVRRTIEITRLSNIIALYDSNEAALDAVRVALERPEWDRLHE